MTPCPSCGQPRSDSARFCAKCGLAVGATPPALVVPAERPSDRADGHDVTAEAVPLARTVAFSPGEVVDNKYEISRVLGEGGMGVVYLARDRNIGVDVVLKSVRSELAHRADVRERTLSEGQALARIDHPNVVRFNAVIVDGPKLWLVMQYIDGESLEARIERITREGRRMPLGEALAFFRQIVEGVAAAHREGLIHRDLKPANVLLRAKDGVAKVSDFGIAKAESDAAEGKGVTHGIIGSLWYMSPEQVHGRRDLDKRVDIYALGIVLFEMLTGHVPFDAESEFELMRMQSEVPLPSVVRERPDVPASVDALLQRATAKNRDHRFASCEELLAALQTLEGMTPAPAAVATQSQAAGATMMTPPPPFVALTGGPHALPGTTNGGQALPAYAPPPHGYYKAPVAQAPSSRGGTGLRIALAAVVVGALAVGVAVTVATKHEDTALAASNSPDASAAPAHSATATASNEGDPLAALRKLAGGWRTADTQRDLDAVLVGDTLEFRIVDASQFGASAYRTGDVRFRLALANKGGSSLRVEDLPRFLPPADYTMGAEARSTCVMTIENVEGRPLRATADGDALEIEFARFEPKIGNFTVQGKQVTSCVGLASLPVTRLPSIRVVRR